VLLGLVYGLNLSLGVGSAALLSVWVVALCLVHLVSIVVLGWDLAVAGLSSVTGWEEAEVFYQQPRSTLTYDRVAGGDAFEWHRERCWPYSQRFEDLYFFFFQLLLIWDLVCGLFFWLVTLVTLLMVGGRAVSFIQVGVGLG